MESVYLDNAATTKPHPEVIEAMMPYLTGDKWHNPSSLYSDGVKVRADIENARKVTADFIGADASEIYFTSSGSESNCWALRGWCDHVLNEGCSPVVITTCIEHKSITACVHALKKTDVTVVELGVDNEGFVDVDELEILLYDYMDREIYSVLVSVQFANNEIGTMQSMREISNVVHRYGALLHVDAVQAAGQIPINVNSLGIDMMTVSGHKLGCPRGSAFLYKKSDVKIEPLIYGTQMDGLRGGTEATHQIVGMAKAVELARDNAKRWDEVELARDIFICKLENIGCKLIGSSDYRLPNNICIMLPQGCGGEEMLYLLDMGSINISTGSACNSQSKESSHVLKAIGLSDEEAARVIRISLPYNIKAAEIQSAFDEIENGIKLLGGNMDHV